MTDYAHQPVMLEECIRALDIKPEGIYVDGTLGNGGHSEEILKRLTTGSLVAIDRDDRALARAGERLSPYGERLRAVKGNFGDIAAILNSLGIDRVDGMLFDLGVSSPQLDETERGFSYMSDAPLDMRMDERASLAAREIVNGWNEAELIRILFDYGEERYARRIAAAIVRARDSGTIETTLNLVDIIKGAMPAAALREKQHPAKRSFQAVRIAVNDELGEVERMMAAAPDRLSAGGRLAVISFHSLEDRIVKNAIASRENGCKCPRDFPVCVCGFIKTLSSVGKKAQTPGAEEIDRNPRSRSAKLRVAERV